MSNPFQDSFLKAGLTNKKKVKQAQRDKKIVTKKIRRGQADSSGEDKQRALEGVQAQAERDRELNRAKDDKARHKAIGAQIKQLIASNTIEPEGVATVFRFEDNKVIREIDVDSTMQKSLVAGTLCIAKSASAYFVIAKPVADKISQRDEQVIVLANSLDETVEIEDDPYKAFEIPDDLMW